MLRIGEILNGNYQIERLLGKGGTATVFLAIHTRLPCKFAVKVITAQYSDDAAFMKRFRQEAEILARLAHPHLVRVTDWNLTPEGNPYLVMELLNGKDLEQLLETRGALPTAEALSIFRQTAEALQSAHMHGIIHRDLKPSNIYICHDGAFANFVRVLDFGIAKLIQDSSALASATAVSSIIGTPAYMSPEQANGDKDLNSRSDQFSLAVVLYEMLSGRRAFYRPAESPLTTLGRVVHEELTPLSLLIPRSPELLRIESALSRALAKNPLQRFDSVGEFLKAVVGEDTAAFAATPDGEARQPRSPLADAPALQLLPVIPPPSPLPVPSTLSPASRATLNWASPKLAIDSNPGSWKRLPIPMLAAEALGLFILSFSVAYLTKPSREPSHALTTHTAANLRSQNNTQSAPAPPAASLPPATLPTGAEQTPPDLATAPPWTERAVPHPPRPEVESRVSSKTTLSRSPLPTSRAGQTKGSSKLTMRVAAAESTKEQNSAILRCIDEVVAGLTELEKHQLLGKSLELGGWNGLQIKPHPDLPAQYRNAANTCLRKISSQWLKPERATVLIPHANKGMR